MSAPRKTLQEYLDWAELKPRTSEWSALVAYNQAKCNQLLLQEYIEKHDKNSIMPPINEPFGTSETTWSWCIDYVTDSPRLSFENNPDNQSAEVNIRMAVVGGKTVSLDDNLGSAQVNRISSYDPLDYPELMAERVQLKDVQGTVNKDGEVLLDLGDPIAQRYIWELKGDRIEHQRRMAGAFFKRKFREAEPERRTFSLGTLAQTTQEFMKPQSFKLRTIMEEGGNSRAAENYGNGALEMRVAMDDELAGGLPGDDWPFPLPSDRPDLDALMIFGSHFFMHGIIGKGTARAFNAPGVKFREVKDSKGFIYELHVEETEGYLELQEFQVTVAGRKVTFANYKLPIYISSDEKLTMTLFGSPQDGHWLRTGMGAKNLLYPISCTVDGSTYTAELSVVLNADYEFSLDEDERRLVVKLRAFNNITTAELPSAFPADVRDYMSSEEFNNSLGDSLATAGMAAFNNLEAIDVFLLNTLLFNSEDAVQLKTLNLTGELICHGSISPRLTTFSIDPLETMLSYDQTQTFTATAEGVTWSVEDLDGNTEGAGSIDATTGVYTSPSLADIAGTYKRVKIVATGPANSRGESHISRALVTVVTRAITLNPLIEIINASKPGETEETRELSAHSMSGELKWSVIGNGSIDATANAEGKNLYRAPLKVEGPESFTIEEVVVKNQPLNKEQSSLMVVKHGPQTLAVGVSYQGQPAGKAKLTVKFNGQEPTGGVAWECVPADAGSVDSAGVFTVNEKTNSQFVLIKVVLDLMGLKFDGFTILPLPLAPLPPKPEPEIPQVRALDQLEKLLSAVSEEIKRINPSSDASVEIKDYLDRIATLTEVTANE